MELLCSKYDSMILISGGYGFSNVSIDILISKTRFILTFSTRENIFTLEVNKFCQKPYFDDNKQKNNKKYTRIVA